MAWRSPHPAALRVDPDADKPSLIGSVWYRREPLSDAWDGPVRIVGVHDNGERGGGLELVVQTVAFTGEPTLTASPESFGAAYTRVENENVAERLEARLRELEARA